MEGIPTCVKLGTPCSPKHLKNISQIHVFISFGFGIKKLRPFDDDQMGREIDLSMLVLKIS